MFCMGQYMQNLVVILRYPQVEGASVFQNVFFPRASAERQSGKSYTDSEVKV